MKNWTKYLTFVCLTLLGFVSVYAPRGRAHISAAGGDETADRDFFEWKRLRDPQTGLVPKSVRYRELAFAQNLPGYGGSGYGGLNSSAFKIRSVTDWTNRGPVNVGGRTRALEIDISNENIILAGTPSGGVWRSTNGGLTWTPSLDASNLQNVSCIAQDLRQGKTNTWYFGSGEGFGCSASGGAAYFLGNGLFKSTDDGVSWNPLSATNSGKPQALDSYFDIVWNVATNPADTANDIVYAATIGYIYKSTNGGTSWTTVLGGGSILSYATDVMVTPSGVVYCTLDSCGPDKGIWRSPDGVTFTNITPAGFPASYSRIVMAFAPSDETQVYFLANTPNSGAADTIKIFKTDDWNSFWKYTYVSGTGSGSGGVWQNRTANLPVTQRPFNVYDSQAGYDMEVKVKPNDANTVFIGGTNIFRSTDGFATSTKITFMGGYGVNSAYPLVAEYPNHHPDQHVFAFFNSDTSAMLNGNDGGVFKTLNYMDTSVAWTRLNTGYVTTMFYTCALDHAVSGSAYVIGGAQDNGSWFTNNANNLRPWVTPRGGDGACCAIANNRSAYYFSIENGKMMKASLDTAGNVLTFARIDPIGAKDYLFVNPYVLDPNNNNRMYMSAGNKLWRNDSLNDIPMIGNWDSITTGWTRLADTLPIPKAYITAVAVSTTPANRVYIGTDTTAIYRIDSAGSANPIMTNITGTLNPNAFPEDGYVSCIAVDPLNGNNVMAVFSNYQVYSLFYSTNAGTSWAKVAGNLEQYSSGAGDGPSCRWASILHVSNGTVFLVATSTGLYATDTLMGLNTVWAQQGGETIGNVVCDMIDTRSSDGMVIVATHGHGIYSGTVTSTQSISGIKNLPAAELYQLSNYPNPAGSQTTITFVLPKRSSIELRLYDAGGRLVRGNLQGSQTVLEAGAYYYSVSTADLQNGMYYYSLAGEGFTATKKMIVIN